jgi:putative drug exporter of the RND superfamily
MSRLQNAVRDEAPSTRVSPPHRRTRRPAVEAIAGWSARHRKTAVFGWLAPVALAYLIGQLLGTPNLPKNDVGQSGQAEQTLQHRGVTAPATEEVLIQARTSGAPFASDPAMRQAVSQVTAALSRLPGSAAGMRAEMAKLSDHVAAVEELMRDVGRTRSACAPAP